MARFVIAGSVNCPYYAKLELLADSLHRNLPNFKIHKMPTPEAEWPIFLDTICKQNKWVHRKSPLVWRELVERGGKGMYIGGFNEFLEYAKCYYKFESDMNSEMMLAIRDENLAEATKFGEEIIEQRKAITFTTVCILNAANSVSYHLIPHILKGKVLQRNERIVLHLCDTVEKRGLLEGVAMEAFDLGCPSLMHTSIEHDLERAVDGASYVIMLDDVGFKCEKGETQRAWIQRQNQHFSHIGSVLDAKIKEGAKVIVTGRRFVNRRTQLIQQAMQNTPTKNIVACPRIIERRSKAVFARKIKVHPTDMKNVIIWGDCSINATPNTYFISPPLARVYNYDGAVWGPPWFSRVLTEVASDTKWLEGDFIEEQCEQKVTTRTLMGRPTSMSEAAAIAQLLTEWVHGSVNDEITSLGVAATGQYGISGVVFSLPVRFYDGDYEIVDDLELDADALNRLQMIKDALESELFYEEEEESKEEEEPVKEEGPQKEEEKKTVSYEEEESEEPKPPQYSADSQDVPCNDPPPPTHADILRDLKSPLGGAR